MNKRRVAVAVSIVLAVTALLYLGGVLGQLFANYEVWLEHDGITGQAQMEPVDWNPIACYPAAFSLNGLKGVALVVAVAGGLEKKTLTPAGSRPVPPGLTAPLAG